MLAQGYLFVGYSVFWLPWPLYTTFMVFGVLQDGVTRFTVSRECLSVKRIELYHAIMFSCVLEDGKEALSR